MQEGHIINKTALSIPRLESLIYREKFYSFFSINSTEALQKWDFIDRTVGVV